MMHFNAQLLLPILLLAPVAAPAQTVTAAPGVQADGRIRYTINDSWMFHADGFEFAEKRWVSDAGWQRVTLPHTWNASDPFDDVPSYRRGVSWYRKRLELSETLRGKRIFLYFEGANQVANVYVNGAFAGSHVGGYTAFAFDISDLVQFGSGTNENLIAVQVDNSHAPQIPPLSVGFALYGGIYRDVWLIATDPVHIDVTDHASSGVYVSTPRVSRVRAEARVRATIMNSTNQQQPVRIVSTLVDASGAGIAESTSALILPARGEISVAQNLPPVPKPKLWSPDDPYLYRLHTAVYDGNVLLDRVTSPIGFRWFEFDADRGFSLNGEKLRLRGTNRHQDYQAIGSALSNEQHVRDLEWIKRMGANFLRLAHYPQDPAVLDAADRIGLLIWEEIPVVNYITPSAEFTRNSSNMLRDMIRQHYNHPSVIIWGTMNEVFLWSKEGARIGRVGDSTYMRQVREFAVTLDSIARAEDPTRATAMAMHTSEDYDVAGLTNIPQVLGVNVYSGWYGGVFDDFGKWLDRRHAKYPRQTLLISEYGSGSDLRLNALVPERFDHSSAWHRLYHEAYLRQINARPYLAGSAIWNQFDFAQPHIGESMPNMNQKGMQTFDRRTKDVYYLYKANWNPEPFVYIASRDWRRRTGTNPEVPAGSGHAPVTQPVDVYSNAGPAELLVNGRSLGVKQPDNVRKATWQVPFVHGDNVIEARAQHEGRTRTDRLVIDFQYYAPDLRDPSVPFEQIAVNVGSNAQYAEDDGVIWQADQPYREGGFGHVGGERKLMSRSVIVTGSAKTGMLVTYRTGLSGYRFDVPDGAYTVELIFAEPDAMQPGQRVFDVAVNGGTLLSRIDLAGQTGRAHPVLITTEAAGGKGLSVEFRAISGEPILNAIRVRKQ